MLAALGLVAIAGCGPDSRLQYADETARLAATAITDVETSGGDNAALSPALDRAHVRLGEIERSIDEWRDHSGSLAYRTHAPCLRAALLQLRAVLQAQSLAVPPELDQAEAMLAEVAAHACPP